MTAATARHADARSPPSPRKSRRPGIPRLGAPTRPEDSSPRPHARHARAFPARGRTGTERRCPARPRMRRRLFLPGEARKARDRPARPPGRTRTPSVVQKNAREKKGRQGGGHEPCSRPFTVLLRRQLPRVRPRVLARCARRAAAHPQTAEPVTSRVAAAPRRRRVSPRACAYAATNAPSRRPRAAAARSTREARAWRRWRRKRRNVFFSHVEEHRNTAFSVSGETTSFGSAETARLEAFSRRLFPKKASDPKEKKGVSRAELGSADASKEPRRRGHFKRSVGDALANPPRVPQRGTRIGALAEEGPAAGRPRGTTLGRMTRDDERRRRAGRAARGEDFDAPRAPFALAPGDPGAPRRRETAALLERHPFSRASSRGSPNPRPSRGTTRRLRRESAPRTTPRRRGASARRAATAGTGASDRAPPPPRAGAAPRRRHGGGSRWRAQGAAWVRGEELTQAQARARVGAGDEERSDRVPRAAAAPHRRRAAGDARRSRIAVNERRRRDGTREVGPSAWCGTASAAKPRETAKGKRRSFVRRVVVPGCVTGRGRVPHGRGGGSRRDGAARACWR